MRIHHFYPRSTNIGDHLVQHGIEVMIRRIMPAAGFELFNINSRGSNKSDYGLTEAAVDRANREADLIVVGGSNLYEGSYGWHWGVHLEAEALKKLRVPLFLMGIGSGSNFASPLHKPSARARNEIKLLNSHAMLSGARDVITLEWMQKLGISNAKLFGDPATFIFNRPPQNSDKGHILITMPPQRFWISKRQFWSVHLRGRPMFKALVTVANKLIAEGNKVIVACNDPIDLPVTQALFNGSPPEFVVCPQTVDEYFQLLSTSRAVVSGRLHTAVVAFSLGLPFLLLDVDQRTHGFVKTYQLDAWSVDATRPGIEVRLFEGTERLLRKESSGLWALLVAKRDLMFNRSMDLLRVALTS